MNYPGVTLQPASYRGVLFYVETSGKRGGRRTYVHEFPKRDEPYAEDLGRSAYGIVVVGYVVGPYGAAFNTPFQTMDAWRSALENALDDSQDQGPATLILPTRSASLQVTCISYTSTERRTQGGYVEFEMTFVEAGQAANSTPTPTQTATSAAVNVAANAAAAAATTAGNTTLQTTGVAPLTD